MSTWVLSVFPWTRQVLEYMQTQQWYEKHTPTWSIQYVSHLISLTKLWSWGGRAPMKHLRQTDEHGRDISVTDRHCGALQSVQYSSTNSCGKQRVPWWVRRTVGTTHSLIWRWIVQSCLWRVGWERPQAYSSYCLYLDESKSIYNSWERANQSTTSERCPRNLPM